MRRLYHICFLPEEKNTSIPGGSFCARLSNYIIKMKKEKTFNQEVEHFSRVLEAEISKKEC